MPKNKQYTKEEKKFIKDMVDSAPKEAPHREVEALGNMNFGPYVAYFKCHDSLINGLRRKGDKLEPGSKNSNLAGILSDQRGYTKEDKEWFIKEFQPYVTKYINDAVNYVGQQLNPETHSSKFQLIDLWINYMKSGEHNPQHNHNGQLSWVIYLDVPDLTEEKNNFKGTGMGPGIIGFHYGENHRPKWAEHTYKYDPLASHMWIFPAQLRHEVLPFFTKDKTRISVSGNLYLTPPDQPSSVKPTDEELEETPKDQYKQ